MNCFGFQIREKSLLAVFVLISIIPLAADADIGTSSYGPHVYRPDFARQAQELIAQGDSVTAGNLLNQINPKSLDPRQLKWLYHLRCYASVNVGDHAQTIEQCSMSIDHSKAFWQDFVNRGSAHAMLGHYERALADYREAVRRGGDYQRLRHAIFALRDASS